MAEKLVPFLEGLAASTEIFCKGQCSNIYSYYPLAFKVIDITKIQAEDNGTLAEFKTRVSQGLRNRILTENFWLTAPMIASVLDPNMRKLRFLEEQQREAVYAKVRLLMTSVTVEAPDDATEPPAKKMEMNPIANFLGSEMFDTDTSFDSGDTDELEVYLNQRIKCYIDPAEWWRKNGNDFKKLRHLARQFLAIQSTSVPSERAFSTAGLTITKLRGSLSPETADKIIFLNKNL